MELGLPVYARRGPKLDGDFPWADLKDKLGGEPLAAIRPHRFAFAPRTAFAALVDSSSDARLRAVLDGWCATASAGRNSDCYVTPLVVIQRTLALSWAWTFLASRPESDGSAGLALEFLVLKLLWADMVYLAPRLGTSHPNNHLLADGFALWYLPTVFPELAAAAGLEAADDSLWLAELGRQTFADGTGFEHSAHYHEFAAELGAAYLILSRRNGREPPAWAVERIAALLRFQAALTGRHGTPVPFGNGIEDTLFPLDPGEGWCGASLWEIGRALFSPGLPPGPAGETQRLRAYWLLGGDLPEAPARPDDPAPLTLFPQGGFAVLADDTAEPGADRLVFRTGPAPDTPVAPGHMHADLLSISLMRDGRPLLVDPGTYSYRGASAAWPADGPNWRAYFAGPAAHNGPCIGEVDPLGELPGDFRRHDNGTRATTDGASGGGLAIAEGAVETPGVLSGSRRAVLQVAGAYRIVADRAPPAVPEGMEVSYGFQFAPGTEVAVDSAAGRIAATADGQRLSLFAAGQIAELEQAEGRLDPPAGWVSPRYGELLAAPQVRVWMRPEQGDAAFLLRPDDDARGAVRQFRLLHADTRGMVLEVATDSGRDLLLLRWGDAGADAAVAHAGLRFVGRLCRLRMAAGRLASIQWLDGYRLDWPDQGVSAHAEEGLPALCLEAGGAVPEGLRLSWPGA